MSFSEELAKAKERALSPEKSEPIDVVVGDALYQLVFTQATGEKWATVTAKHPLRVDVPIDRQYGYNYHTVTAEIAESTCEITQDGDPITLTVERRSSANPNPVNQWADLFAVIDGAAYVRLADAVFQLNQWGPDLRVAALKKASRVASEPNSD